MDTENNSRNKIEENIQEYLALRNEIISMQERERNVWIYMYVLYSTLFVLGLQLSHYLFLVSYIILIPFQCVINDFLWSVTKIATYIRVFFENERCDMNWENLHIYEGYQDYYKKKSNTLTGIIRTSGSVHLGVISTGCFCGYTLFQNRNGKMFVINGLDIFFMLFSIILLFLILKITQDYRKKHYDDLKRVMEMYKKVVIDRNNKKR